MDSETKLREALSKLDLWFFCDLVDEQRHKLFSLFGLPNDELRMQGHQRIALRHVLSDIATPPARSEAVDDAMVERAARVLADMIGAHPENWVAYENEARESLTAALAARPVQDHRCNSTGHRYDASGVCVASCCNSCWWLHTPEWEALEARLDAAERDLAAAGAREHLRTAGIVAIEGSGMYHVCPLEPTEAMVEAGVLQLRALREVGIARDDSIVMAVYDGLMSEAPFAALAARPVQEGRTPNMENQNGEYVEAEMASEMQPMRLDGPACRDDAAMPEVQVPGGATTPTLGSATPPKDAGQAVAWVVKDDPMFAGGWRATTPILYSTPSAAPDLIPLYTHPAADEAVREGYELVPREPTPEMWDAAENAMVDAEFRYEKYDAAVRKDAHRFPTMRIWQAVVAYRAMRDAARQSEGRDHG